MFGKERCVTGFKWGHLKERDHLEDSRRWEGSIKMNLEVIVWERVDRLVWFRVRRSGGLLWTRF